MDLQIMGGDGEEEARCATRTDCGWGEGVSPTGVGGRGC